MHGHGDRPHLCLYPGCDRGIPGNGFPRRYNLFDHMKRVHDHKEDIVSATVSPVLTAGTQTSKKSIGRKRKASRSPVLQPATQRSKATPVAQQHVQAIVVPKSGHYQGAGHAHSVVYEEDYLRNDPHRQRLLYSQWANQRDLVAKQMDFVHSPDDEDSLHRLSQNIEQLRRLSQEARRR